jgi:hypothetical protein
MLYNYRVSKPSP